MMNFRSLIPRALRAQRRPATQQTYGWRVDLTDTRDYLYAANAAALPLPSKADLRQYCTAVENQGRLGSCTANALVGVLELLHKQMDDTEENLSRLFVYYNERVIEHTVMQDSGARLRDGIKTLAKDGVCLERQWPYKISRFRTKPNTVCYAAAVEHCIKTYVRLQTLSDMKHCLADGFPFVFGFLVYKSFESKEVARTGVVSMPKADEELIGGHAVMAVGYDDSINRLIVRNSWGAQWGQSGYFTMPYAYVTTAGLADDFWTIRS